MFKKTCTAFLICCIATMIYNAVVMSKIARDLHTIATPVNPGEYQIDLDTASIKVFQYGRYVGEVPNGTSAIDTLFWKDND